MAIDTPNCAEQNPNPAAAQRQHTTDLQSHCLVLGSRGSTLALWQTGCVGEALEKAHPGLRVEIKVIHTTGDKNQTAPLEQIGSQGVFTKELEAALLNHEIDACVHSMKDLQSLLAPGCCVAACLPRADARDALVLGTRIQTNAAGNSASYGLDSLPQGARIATGSLRRAAQIRAFQPGLIPTPVRGNVETRLKKIHGDGYEAGVLASAGLDRLGLEQHISQRLDPTLMIPAVGQGAIGVEIRTSDASTADYLAAINDQATFDCVMAERLILSSLNGSCRVPLGAYCRPCQSGGYLFDAFVSSVDGSHMARVHRHFNPGISCAEAAAQLWEALKEQGAEDIRARIDTASGGGAS